MKRVGAFVDFKRIRVYAGNGGNGGISFRKQAKEPNGPPNGGTAGKGGDVYVNVSDKMNSLAGVLNVYKAGNGQDGRGKDLNGAKGKDLEIHVPVGTKMKIISDLQTEESSKSYQDLRPEWHVLFESDIETNEEILLQKIENYYHFRTNVRPKLDRLLIMDSKIPHPIKKQQIGLEKDFMTPGERFLLAKGGIGGLGNTFFNSYDIRGPAFALKGGLGHSYLIEFELKTIADAGLVGFPNAGKSSFLSAVSRAHPKIAPYPFTTLNPYLGIIDYADHFTLSLADIPGLIHGAHKNVGLGHTFLRHIERSKILVYVIDISLNSAIQDFEHLKYELEAYSQGLTKKPSMIVANKADIDNEFTKINLEKMANTFDIPIVPVSAKEGKNILQATLLMRQIFEKSK